MTARKITNHGVAWWCADFTNEAGERIRAKAVENTKRSAVALEVQLRTTSETAAPKEARTNFAVFVRDVFLPRQEALCSKARAREEGRIKPATLLVRRYDLKNHLLPHFSAMNLDQITKEVIIDFQESLMPKLNSPASRSKVLATLQLLLTYAHEKTLIAGVPKFPKSAKTQAIDESKFYTTEQQERLKDCAVGDWAKTAILFMLDSGARPGEVCAIRWGHIANGNITIQDTGVHGKPSGETKSGKVRLVPLTDRLAEALIKHREAYPDEEFIFAQKGRTSMCYGELKEAVRVAAKIAGLTFAGSDKPKTLTPHALRHSFASSLANNGYSVYELSKRLGHANTKTTEEIYVHEIRTPEADERFRKAREGNPRPKVVAEVIDINEARRAR